MYLTDAQLERLAEAPVTYPEFIEPGCNPGGLVTAIRHRNGHTEWHTVNGHTDVLEVAERYEQLRLTGRASYLATYDGDSGLVHEAEEVLTDDDRRRLLETP